VSLCVAVDSNEHILTTTSPSSGVWQMTYLPRSTGRNETVGLGNPGLLTSVSCPSVSLCAIISPGSTVSGASGGGDVVVSANPTGGAAAWQVIKLPVSFGGPPSSISCPTTTFCIATGAQDTVTSTDPTGGAQAWQSSGSGPNINQISCASTSLCAGSLGSIQISSFALTADPTEAGTATWRNVAPPEGREDFFWLASCPSTAICVGIGTDQRSTDSPSDVPVVTVGSTASPGSWVTARFDFAFVPTAVSCNVQALCAAAGTFDGVEGVVAASSNPSAGGGSWSASTTGGAPLTAIACPSASLCVAGDELGNITVGTAY